ncbi:thioredoxin domain-containing protein [Actomonas aquatica]|uniref:Thioredoxin domain-containing protein n=1 Tax=Actomonas aquatica TaxID=2866162 RepID=A0ABZ1C4T7_9BACT|nr:thioredoxin domain-containing protein [Opitutus sp. WL0086]WRQ86362.1 thioredoxin domain-containing protein [Opitutus sp. WL0086]
MLSAPPQASCSPASPRLRRLCFTLPLLLSLGGLTNPCTAANRLADATSPYLRQHADQPVDWYPWSEDAFARARAENKPIFLSIGYSTCHWCHVMADESFSDPAIAAVLNDGFIAIKVDREQRPDLDRVYQSFVQALGSPGGWPLNVWLTPDRQPFYGGTYFPPADEGRRPGFTTVLQRIAGAWAADPDRLRAQSTDMLAALSSELTPAPDANSADTVPDWPTLRNAALDRLAELFDTTHGGFDPAAKFPAPVTLEFLLDQLASAPIPADRERARHFLTTTLHAIVRGGLHDHVGGGFHRYTVDPAWRVPHFEKTLYDQAQLIPILLTTWQYTDDDSFRAAAVDTLAYLNQQLALPAGGFASAEDADAALPGDPTQHREGAFYTWTAAELAAVLPAADLDLFRRAFAVRDTGNVAPAHDPTGELAGSNTLALAPDFAPTAAEQARLNACIDLLNTHRAQRPRPARDDKVVTAWNGFALSAFARAAQILDDPAHLATAQRTARFLRAHLYDETTGHLARSFHDGQRDAVGFPEDYAALIQGLIDLYETDFDPTWLAWARELQTTQDELFWDDAHGGYFANAATDTTVVLRLKVDHDNTEPAATSLAVRNLGRLAALFHDDDLLNRARLAARALAPTATREPAALPSFLAATGWLTGDAQQALLHAAPGPTTDTFLHLLRTHPHPRRVTLRIDATSQAYFAPRVPLIAALPDETPTAPTLYLCENFVCQLPVTTTAEVLTLLTPPPTP